MHSTSSKATERIGQLLGQNLKGGEVIELMSDLGGGKTTLVRGIARGIGSSDKVSSPTFTVSKEYNAGKLRIVHYDFYRLHDAGILQFELAESLNDSHTITIIEWADIVLNVLPEERITTKITTLSDDERLLAFSVHQSLGYILEGFDGLAKKQKGIEKL
jgi:tRNA threonylcarbamoyladenosine biosynthesis protein TsaE